MGCDCFELFKLLRLQLSLILVDLVFDPFSDKFISSETLSSFDIFDHKISKFGNMARVLKNNRGSYTCRIDFQHVFFKYKVISPQLLDIGFYLTTYRS